MKKLYFVLLASATILMNNSIALASNEKDLDLTNENQVYLETIEETISKPLHNDFEFLELNKGTYYERIFPTFYRAGNVRRHEEWSSFERASNTLTTGSHGGTISSTIGRTHNTQVSGSISGLGISTNQTVVRQTGYSFNVGPHRRVHIEHRVRYRVETGTRDRIDATTGRVISSTPYTVRTPLHGEFRLANS